MASKKPENLVKAAFTPEEDRAIIELIEKIGCDWRKMAQMIEYSRAPNDIKSRYVNHLRRVACWDGDATAASPAETNPTRMKRPHSIFEKKRASAKKLSAQKQLRSEIRAINVTSEPQIVTSTGTVSLSSLKQLPPKNKHGCNVLAVIEVPEKLKETNLANLIDNANKLGILGIGVFKF